MSGATSDAAPPATPWPHWAAPEPADCEAATAALAALHGLPTKPKKAAAAAAGGAGAPPAPSHEQSVLDSLVRTILSQNTTDVTSLRAFRELKTRFPTWQAVRVAPASAVSDAIRCLRA